MKKIITLVAFLMVFGSVSLWGADVTSRIDLLKGEKWWGIFIAGGKTMPFEAPFERVDIDRGRTQMTPLLVSSRGRYIWSPEPFSITFTGDSFVIESPLGEIKAVSAGRTLREAYLVCCHRNFPPDGNNPSPDLTTAPVYDPYLELGFEATGEQLSNYADRILQAGYPAGTLVVPAGWQSSIGSYKSGKHVAEDFGAWVRSLHEKGFRVMLTITPFVSGDGTIFRRYREEGMFVSRPDSSVVMAEWTGGYSAFYDVTRPDVIALLQENLSQLRSQYGVDGFLFDCAGTLPYLQFAQGGGREFLLRWSELSGDCNFCQYTISRGNGLVPYIHNLRLNLDFNWDFLRRVTSDMISANLLGYPYTVIGSRVSKLADLDQIDPKVFLRYLQLSSVMPVMNIAFAPWRISDPEVAASCKAIVNDRARLGAYFEQLMTESKRTAEPVLRHLEYEFPRNGFSNCDDQFMLGSRYLIAPLLDGKNSRMVRFPRGIWIDASGKRYRGPLVTTVTASNDHVLFFESEKEARADKEGKTDNRIE